MKSIAFFDLETSSKDHQIFDIGCVRSDGATFHENSLPKFLTFISESELICGHNVFKHDLKYIHQATGNTNFGAGHTIDTLYLSPLLFPRSPYHRLLKDDKLQTEELNNPLNDSIKARDLFYDEVEAYDALPYDLKSIFYNLLGQQKEFAAFFQFVRPTRRFEHTSVESLIRQNFTGKICEHSPVSRLILESPVSLAYALALVNVTDKYSLTPPWVLHNYPDVERVLFFLRNKPCVSGCTYCNEALNPFKTLKRYFGYDNFRSYGGEPLQEKAVNAAIQNRSLLAVFPTGGGKSITFQIPALMSADNAKALTVIISPLQSLMKDQVDNLEKKHGITEAVTINGLLNPVERQQVFERVAGSNPELALANILYLSPESLRSISIYKLLLNRKIARFVIDEAHCFSSWGQDFRVDYLYIGDFIKTLQEKKGLKDKIPVSCFTATAKQKVIEDIRAYFKTKLEIDLEIFRANASRTNLQYKVYSKNDEEQKYAEVRRLLEGRKCPTIIYVSRTKKAYLLAQKLCEDGFDARPYHGKMDKDEKTANQNAFIDGEVDIMVATSAFGMGVDKSNVGMVIHYEISDSLENYVQEAGRAGRDEAINADCYVLFNEDDLDKHLLLLNQTKLDQKEINQVWKAIKDLTKTRDKISHSALEIARRAGWDDTVAEIETRVTTAVAALEDAGYVRRGQNMPRVFANSILAKTAQEAIERINDSEKFVEKQKEKAIRIIKKLFSSKSKRLSTEEAAESRVDYISDHLGIPKEEVIQIIQLLRDEKILADTKDLTAFIKRGDNSNRSLAILEEYRHLETFFFSRLSEEAITVHLKELNEQATAEGCKDVSPNKLKTIVNFWVIKNWVKRKSLEYSKNHLELVLSGVKEELTGKMERRHGLGKSIVQYLFQKAASLAPNTDAEEVLIEFSVQELKEAVEKEGGLFTSTPSNEDIEDTLVYLTRIEAIKIEGGFLVIYNRLTINRLEKNNKIQYKQEDYQKLSQFYSNKVQQVHIVGEYAKKMIENYNDALRFVDDYFRLNYTSFLNKYFPGSRQDEIKRKLTPGKFRKLFGDLSLAQFEIINDSKNQHIVVAAGPGSGKTRVLVHKLASLLLAEDVKHEQLLMLTFSRAAATEFKKRLIDLIENAANYVEIKTFHSYCFDLVGRVGNLEGANTILQTAVEKIKSRDIEPSRITKGVLVVDEAQDMNEDEFVLVKALMEQNEEMRVILVGDDDQNIYEFRGSDSKYMQQLIAENGAKKYDLVVNYRSKANIVSVANQWATRISKRLKDLPIIANDATDGNIQIVQYGKTNLITPLVESIKTSDLSGSTCILTRTNDEAAQITGLLIKAGFAAKLIQSNDGFNLYNLQELRFFTDYINRNIDSPVVSDEDWIEGVKALNQNFQTSNKLEWCRIIIREFESANRAKKYKSDWKAFLMESKFEDFIEINGETIYVSTIHKAKGREFNNVFVLLTNFEGETDECKRQLYVAMTRAKTNLSIHYNQTFLNKTLASQLTYTRDSTSYEEPKVISCVLTHRNVQLGYFEFVQHRINGLTSGMPLYINTEGLETEKGLVIKFSKDFANNLDHLVRNGYALQHATANFLLHWHNTNNYKEVIIVLPEITLVKP